MKLKKNLEDFGLKGSIRGKLVLAFILLVIIPFTILGMIAYQSEKAALRERIRGHLTSIADIQKGRVQAWLYERSNDARFLAGHPRMSVFLRDMENVKNPAEYKNARLYDEIQLLLDPIRNNYGYLDAIILDNKGKIVASSSDEYLGQSRSDEPYFAGAMKSAPNRIFIQDIYKDRFLGKFAMAFSGPIADPAHPGVPLGVAVLIVDLDKSFYPIFAGWPGMGKTGDTIIVRRDNGNLVILNRLRYNSKSPLELRYPIEDKKPLASYLSSLGGEGIEETNDYRGVKVLAAYRHIPETGWGFVVKEDYDDAFASVKRLTRNVAIMMIGTFIIVVFLIYVVANKIASPIVSINSLARKVAGGDFSVRLPIKTNDEIGSLARSFNDMASALSESRNQVDEKNTELERANGELVNLAQSLEGKVKTRTQELEEMNRALFSMMDDLDERTAALEKSQKEMTLFAEELEESRNRVRENLDIVERANTELRRMDRMKDHFLGMISHELRTPLSLITGYSSNLLQDESVMLEPRIGDALEGISRGADRLKTIVTEMLDVSQIDAKGLQLSFNPENFGLLVENALHELDTFIKERRQTVVIGGYGDLPEVMVDSGRMHQVIVNIIGNAIKFTPDGGSISISFKIFHGQGDVRPMPAVPEAGSYLDITIRDSGIGLDKEELDRIFEKFYEVGDIDKHSTSKFGFLGRGVGLGLPIARGIVEAHGGRLWAESLGHNPRLCPGSVFHIALPVNIDIPDDKNARVLSVVSEIPDTILPEPEISAVSPQVKPETDKRKVLVIEDDPDILGLTRMVLGQKYELLTATGGVEGIKTARQEMPGLILLDVYMEDMNGYEVCEILKKDDKTCGIKIAMFTAGVQRWEVEKGYKSGADDYITKPFKPAELMSKVDSIINGSLETAVKG